MRRFFYTRLALTNIRKNKSIYYPYLLTGTLIVALIYILDSVGTMVENSSMAGADYVAVILNMSRWVGVFVAIIVLFYINSFIMKRRKKEFGLYCILGMEKRHLSIVVGMEIIITAVVCICLGIVSGAVLSQLMFLVLLKLVKIPAVLSFSIPVSAVVSTAGLFLIEFGVILLFDILSVSRTDPIKLLHAQNEGEREPKARWSITLIGAAALGAGYFVALYINNAYEAIALFILAVILVVIGTYCLFLAGSIAVLKLLKKKKRFYYNPDNFISVSGLMYRMKQNAVGLASICILSTAVLVTLSTSVSLFIGEEDTLKAQFPYAFKVKAVTSAPSEEEAVHMQHIVGEKISSAGFHIKDGIFYTNVSMTAYHQGNSFSLDKNTEGSVCAIKAIPLDDYNRLTGADKTLAPGEALVYKSNIAISDKITLQGLEYKIKEFIGKPDFIDETLSISALIVVLPSADDLKLLSDQLSAVPTTIPMGGLYYNYFFDLEEPAESFTPHIEEARMYLSGQIPGFSDISSVDVHKVDFYQMYGSILFVGIFLVVIFLIATILIIYYKQITEGYDDRNRFQIMQKVGMGDREVKRTIQKQVLMVFFLPAVTAVIHTAFAFKALCKVMQMFSLTNIWIFVICTAASVAGFILVYLFVYRITARIYYKIIQGKM